MSLAYFLLFSAYFAIKNIEIEGLKSVSDSEVRSELETILEQKGYFSHAYANYFTLRISNLSEILLEEFPKIQNAAIDKIYPDTLRVKISEREIVGVWCRAKENGCFYIDKEGVVFETAPKSYGSIVFLVTDKRDTDSGLGKAVLNREDILKFEKITGLLSRNFPFGVREFVINENGKIEISTSENWKLLLGDDGDIKNQFSNLKYVLDEEIREKRLNLEYVDLRLGNRIYYKMKN